MSNQLSRRAFLRMGTIAATCALAFPTLLKRRRSPVLAPQNVAAPCERVSLRLEHVGGAGYVEMEGPIAAIEEWAKDWGAGWSVVRREYY